MRRRTKGEEERKEEKKKRRKERKKKERMEEQVNQAFDLTGIRERANVCRSARVECALGRDQVL